MSYASYKKRKERNQEKSLYEEIEQLESEEPSNTALHQEKMLSLEKLRKTKMQGQIRSSRTRWVEEGENPPNTFVTQNLVNLF